MPDAPALPGSDDPAALARPRATRARSPEAKALVRAEFVRAGRHLFATQPYDSVSLRAIAQAAGYVPSAIYKLFEDRDELFLAIREEDFDAALATLEQAVRRQRDPAARLRRLFLAAVAYWVAHPEHYEVLFIRPRARPRTAYKDGTYFGESPVSQRSWRLWSDTVQALFDSWPRHPLPVKRAVECLMLAMHGLLVIPSRQLSRPWSDNDVLARDLVDSFITAWRTEAADPA